MSVQANLTEDDVVPGMRVRHRKGGEYMIVAVAKHSETHEPLVVYADATDPLKVWARPLAMFLDAGRFTRMANKPE